MNTTVDQIHAASSTAADKVGSSPAYQAYRILHFGFVVAPILAGLDKFFHLLVNWDQYFLEWWRECRLYPRTRSCSSWA